MYRSFSASRLERKKMRCRGAEARRRFVGLSAKLAYIRLSAISAVEYPRTSYIHVHVLTCTLTSFCLFLGIRMRPPRSDVLLFRVAC